MMNKIAARLKIKFNPKGFSRIKAGYGRGILWSHLVSDTRYLTGNYESELAEWLVSNLKLGKSFIDIGANAGYFSLIAEKYAIRSDQKIIAVEPLPYNVNLIQDHLLKNQSSKIEVVNCAVSSSCGVVEFSDSGNPSANTYVKESSLYISYPKIKVNTITLDHLIEKYELKDFVVKIDVEGAELDALIGFAESLNKYKPELILATHDCHVPGVEKACLNLLASHGYTAVPLHEMKEVTGQKDYRCYVPFTP
ncbi:MAG: FkbM family methyltransferase [Crocinitomicaceae bacterium]|nr:FkbM family methyltransferase [Crocinitomicaceae bacterium]